MSGLAPISQWCRVWRSSEISKLSSVASPPSLGTRSAAWVGAIIAEFGSQSSYNLKEVSAAATLSTSTFSAARAIAVWNGFDRFDELLKRHEMLAHRQRDEDRTLAAEQLIPLWYVLAGDKWQSRPPADARRLLEPFTRILNEPFGSTAVAPEALLHFATIVARERGARDRASRDGSRPARGCFRQIGSPLDVRPKSAATSAILGFSASLVDPGAPLLPELLRRYSQNFSAAAVGLGAFAGVWFPVRVLSEHGGLGRLISKQLLGPSDLFEKPTADISFDELLRWTGGTFNGPLQIRGLMLRTLFVELVAGVVVPIATLRNELPRSEAGATPTGVRQPSFELTPPADGGAANRKGAAAKASSSNASDELTRRIEALEKGFQEITKAMKAGMRSNSTRSGKK